MNTVDASVILEDAYRMIGWDPDQLEPRQEQMARVCISKALQEIWESWWWEQLMACAKFPGATVYTAAATFATGAFCFFPATQLFYQAMQPTTGNAPAVLGLVDPAQYSDPQAWNYPNLTGGSNAYGLNVKYWAQASTPEGWGSWVSQNSLGPDYIVGVNDTGLPVGTVLRYPADGNYYQLYAYSGVINFDYGATGHFPGVSEVFTQDGLYLGYPYYTGNQGNFMWWDGSNGQWVLANSNPTTATAGNVYWYGPQDAPMTPDQVASWNIGALGLAGEGIWLPTPVAGTAIYGDPSNANNWTQLTEFVPVVPVTGDVRAVGQTDPRNSAANGWQPFIKTMDGYRLPGWYRGMPYVWYRLPTPIITGDAYNASLSYTQATYITYTIGN